MIMNLSPWRQQYAASAAAVNCPASGKVVNVYSGEILQGMEIAVLDGRICYVGPSAAHTRGERTEILDAAGQFVAPGFIDRHTHIGHFARPFENLQSFLPRGTTALVASCDELSTVFGYAGLKFFWTKSSGIRCGSTHWHPWWRRRILGCAARRL
jgi:adenine deaminase